MNDRMVRGKRPATIAVIVCLGLWAPACDELLASPPSDAEEELCADIDELGAVVHLVAENLAGPAATFASFSELSTDFYVDAARLYDEGSDLSGGAEYLAEQLGLLSIAGQTPTGLMYFENVRLGVLNLQDRAGC